MKNSLIKAFSRPAFVVCLLTLGAAAAGLYPYISFLRIQLQKKPLPLKRDLAKLDKGKLWPYEFVQSLPVDPGSLNALQTDKYIQWIVRDTRIRAERNPLAHALLMVTYYTGDSGQVPHVPEECYLGSGFQPLDVGDPEVAMKIPGLGPKLEDVTTRALTFRRTSLFESQQPTVVYTFCVNGEFAAERNHVRLLLKKNPLDTYAFFSKVEVRFGLPSDNPPDAPRDAAIRAAAELFRVLLPVLYDDHWPDYEEANRQAKRESTES